MADHGILDVRGIQPQFLQGRGAKRGQQHIGACQFHMDALLARLGLEVGADHRGLVRVARGQRLPGGDPVGLGVAVIVPIASGVVRVGTLDAVKVSHANDARDACNAGFDFCYV